MLVPDQTVLGAGTVTLLASVPPGPAVVMIINNSGAAVAIGSGTTVTLTNSGGTTAGGALIPAGAQVTLSQLAGSSPVSLYAVCSVLGTVSTFISNNR